MRGLIVASVVALSAAVLRGAAEAGGVLDAGKGGALAAVRSGGLAGTGRCICDTPVTGADDRVTHKTTTVTEGSCPFFNFKFGATCALGVAISLPDFSLRLQADPDYLQLKDALGSTSTAQAIVTMLYDRMLVCHDAMGITAVAHQCPNDCKAGAPLPAIFVRGADVDAFYNIQGIIMDGERRILATQKKYIRELFAEAAEGKLRARALSAEAADRMPWAQAESWTQPAAPHVLAPAKAAQWSAAVATLRNGGWKDAAKLKSAAAALMAISGEAMPAFRGPPYASKYASSVTDGALLPFIIEQANAFPSHPNNAEAWKDLAVAMLGSLGHAQAFVNGNKRMTRAVYYAIMVDKFTTAPAEFVAPKNAVAQQLYNME